MSEQLTETDEEIARLLATDSWSAMDEEQRDRVMRNVVLPRYMKTSASGTVLGPTAWAALLGASPGAVKKRVQRLQQSQIGGDAAGTPVTKWDKDRDRAARQTIRTAPVEDLASTIANERPELAAHIAAELALANETEADRKAVAARLQVSTSGMTVVTNRMKIIEAQGKLELAVDLLNDASEDITPEDVVPLRAMHERLGQELDVACFRHGIEVSL